MKTTNSFLITAAVAAVLIISCNQKTAQVNNEPQGRVKIEAIGVASKIAGRIEKIYVREGQHVNPGDTLLVIAVPEIGAKLEQADGAIEAASGQLQLANNGATSDQLMQVQSQADAAAAQMEFAAQSLQRVKNMFADSLVPAQQLDDATAKYNMAKAQLNAIKARQQEIKAVTRPETIQSAKGQLLRATGAKNEVLQAAKERIILAPAGITIESIALKEGELATPGYTIINGRYDNAISFRFTIGESRINAYHTGQEVKIAAVNTAKTIRATIVAVKQLPRYADNTSTAPNRQVAEGFYELKAVPVNINEAAGWYDNATVLLQQ